MSRIVTFSSLKGGVGKTTCTILFAEALLAAGHRLLLVDMDPQHSLTTYYRALGTVSVGNGDVMSYLDSGARALQSTTVVQDRLSLVPGTMRLSSLATDPPSGRKMRRIIRRLKQLRTSDDYDYVLMDTSPTVSSLSLLTLPVTDYLMVITTPEVWSVRAVNLHLENLETQIKRVGSDLVDVSVVTNAFDSSRRGDQVVLEAMRDTFPDYLVEPPIPHSKAVANFVLKNRDMARYMAPVRAAVRAIASSRMGDAL